MTGSGSASKAAVYLYWRRYTTLYLCSVSRLCYDVSVRLSVYDGCAL